MRSRTLGLSLLLTALAAAWLLSRGAGAQAVPGKSPTKPASGQEPQQPIRVQVQLVNLYATVRDAQKRIVTDLTQDEFRIFEDGQEQKLAFFAKETALPITLGLLIDTSGSQESLLGAEQQAANRFFERVLRRGDLAMVINFDLDVDLLSDFTGDRAQLERAILRARINAPSPPGPVQGPFPQRDPKGTSFYDAIYLACREKLTSEVGRKALVILTDAEDFGSKVKLEEALETAQRTDTVVHILLIADPRQYLGFYRGDSVAKKLTTETGGRVIPVQNEKKLEEAFDQISEELRSQYTLGYYPSNPAQDGRFRKVKIETTRKGLRALARKGYYAPKD